MLAAHHVLPYSLLALAGPGTRPSLSHDRALAPRTRMTGHSPLLALHSLLPALASKLAVSLIHAHLFSLIFAQLFSLIHAHLSSLILTHFSLILAYLSSLILGQFSSLIFALATRTRAFFYSLIPLVLIPLLAYRTCFSLLAAPPLTPRGHWT
ncbi:hypothetical protein K523DRAFT_323972 [Schizophyllum commune Tattone D]|nr:hypothetical protein K523DRAFT_323972 [Schizophyllum commune Tattone D]